uniref:Uncharacterized protein n=1 Tax=Opuntia streptacantha TaxID=393608 RepID=A0A7C9DYJ1_OPUST
MCPRNVLWQKGGVRFLLQKRSRMHCTGPQWIQIQKLKPFCRFYTQGSHHQPTSAQTNLLLLFRRSLMHMGLLSTKKQIRLCTQLLLSHSYLQSCLAIGAMVYACYLQHYSLYSGKRSFPVRNWET